MTEPETNDPFAPQEAGGKMKFCKLKLFANPVTLESGASYTVQGVHDKDGNTREWRGKRLDKTSKRFHIILHARATDKDGNDYEMARDYLNSDKPYTKIVHPALLKVFGETGKFPVKEYAFVQVEEVPTGESFEGRDGTTVNKTAWKVVAKFANEAALKAAETKHFSRFTNSNGNGASEPVAEGLSFSEDMITVFKKNAKKGAAFIVENLVDDDQIEKYGKDSVTAAIEKLIA